jgi:hypothetical protein
MNARAVLDSRNAEACANLLRNGTHTDDLLSNFESATLPGALALFTIASRSASAGPLRRAIRDAARNEIAPWNFILDAWDGKGRLGRNALSAQPFEFRRISSPSTQEDIALESSAFEQRFLASVSNAGFESGFAKGMALVLHELIDNVLQHSCVGQVSAPAIAGYQVSHRYFTLAVSDLGHGFLASLSNSSEWRQLVSEEEAVLAVIKKGASRREAQGEGEGFKELFKVLVDKGSLIRIRSRELVAVVMPTAEGRRAETHSIGDAPGVNISICCRLGAETLENLIDFSCSITQSSD